MLNTLGIRSHLLILTLAPSLLLALSLGIHYTRLQFVDMQQQLEERGQLLAEQLAVLAAPLLSQGQEQSLQRVLNQALNQADVRTLTALSPDRSLRAHAGPSMLTSSPPSDPLSITYVQGQTTTRLLMPVLSRHLYSLEQRLGDETRLLGWLELELSNQAPLLGLHRNLLVSLGIIGFILIVTALLALHLSTNLCRPLNQITQAIARIREGHLETRLPPLGSSELNELAEGVNSMAEALLKAHEDLQQNIEQTMEDIQQNMETIEIQNIELDLARKEAEKASRIKSEFLANISHEIRTPLNSILGFTTLLQKNQLNARQQDQLNAIEISAKNLMAIINEILDFSRIEAGKLILEPAPFDLRDLIEETLNSLAPSAHDKHLELACLIYHDTPTQLVGDAARLRQVLTNLVNNAIKFTDKGSVVVRALLEDETEHQAQLCISVQDTGVGLTQQDITQLFQAFCQTDNSLSRQSGGTGLGLAISKHLIEQMKGKIHVDSQLEVGSCFSISISLPKVHKHQNLRIPLSHSNIRVALVEPYSITRQALIHQLEDLGLHTLIFEQISTLHQHLQDHPDAAQSMPILLLDQQAASAYSQWPELAQYLEQHNYHCILICEHNSQSPLLDTPNVHALTKPVRTSKLRQLLIELTQGSAPKPAPTEPLNAQTPRILCVDDNPSNLRLIETFLNDMGAEVCAVSSGAAALEAIQRQHFDLVFMDIQMPVMDGRQTTLAIRQWENTRDTPPLPIVALTAHALTSEKRTLLQKGLDDYLTKPINEQQLAKTVLKWTGRALNPQATATANTLLLPEPRFAVLDPEEGLRRAAGKTELAQEMLSMLLTSLPKERQAIQQARYSGNQEALIQQVHHLHGATQYCGVPQLRQACYRCETLLNQQHPASEAALDELDAAIERLLLEVTPQHA